MFARSIALATAAAARLRRLSASIVEIGPWKLKVWRGGPPDGEPWLLLHGMGATSATYFPLVGDLRRDCRVVIPELSANGGTKGPTAALGVAQTEQVLKKIDGLLAKSGTNKSKLLSATVYISDMAQKAAMNEAWLAWIDRKNPPTRACVAVELGSKETLVEIVVTAAK